MAQFRNRESLALELPRYGVVQAGEVITVPDEDADAFLGEHWEVVKSVAKPVASRAANTPEG